MAAEKAKEIANAGIKAATYSNYDLEMSQAESRQKIRITADSNQKQILKMQMELEKSRAAQDQIGDLAKSTGYGKAMEAGYWPMASNVMLLNQLSAASAEYSFDNFY